MIQSTWLNGLSHTYKVVNGVIQQKSYLLTEAYTRLATPIGTYEFDTTFGCYIPTWINTRQTLTENKVKLEIARALNPMITSGRADGLLIMINQILLNAVYYTVNIYDSNNNSYQLINNYTKP